MNYIFKTHRCFLLYVSLFKFSFLLRSLIISESFLFTSTFPSFFFTCYKANFSAWQTFNAAITRLRMSYNKVLSIRILFSGMHFQLKRMKKKRTIWTKDWNPPCSFTSFSLFSYTFLFVPTSPLYRLFAYRINSS